MIELFQRNKIYDSAMGEWRNYRYYLANELQYFRADFNGYLYANYNDTDLHFTGDLFAQPSMEYQLSAESTSLAGDE
jgi:hypothetical protein